MEIKKNTPNYDYQGEKKYNNLNEKFYFEIKFFSKMVKQSRYLTADEIDACVNDAYISFTQAIKRKNIDTSNFNNYKGYMYITIRNKIYAENNKKKDDRNFVDEEIDISYDNHYDNQMDIITRINSLTQFEKQIFDHMVNKTKYNDIGKELNILRDNVGKIAAYIKKRIFPDYKGTVDAFSKKKRNGEYQPITKYIDYEYNDFYGE